MIDIGVGEENVSNRAVARLVRTGLQLRRAFDLPRQIGRGIDQEPVQFWAANRNARLRLRRDSSSPRGEAIRAGTVPLWQAATGGTPENTNANRSTLARSDRAGVAGALEKNRQSLQRRFDPLLFCSFHSVVPIKKEGSKIMPKPPACLLHFPCLDKKVEFGKGLNSSLGLRVNPSRGITRSCVSPTRPVVFRNSNHAHSFAQ